MGNDINDNGPEEEGMDTSFDEALEEANQELGKTGEKKGKEDYEDKSKSFAEDEELPDLNTEKLVMKDAFEEPVEVTIKAVKMNIFGKPCLSIMHDSEEFCGQVNISPTVYMQLKEKFGNKAANFRDKKVILKAVPFSKDVTKKGKTSHMEGYELKVSFP